MANDLNDRPEAAHPDISRKGAPELGLPIRSETGRRPTQACRAVSRTRGAYCQARIRKQDALRIGEIPLVPVPATWISAASNSSNPNWSLSRRLDCCGWRRSDTPTIRRWAICSICRFPLSFAAPSLPARPGCQTPRWVGRNDLRCPGHLLRRGWLCRDPIHGGVHDLSRRLAEQLPGTALTVAPTMAAVREVSGAWGRAGASDAPTSAQRSWLHPRTGPSASSYQIAISVRSALPASAPGNS
jgi:hypothetical protein